MTLSELSTIVAIGLSAVMIYKGFFESKNLKRQGESLMAGLVKQYEETLSQTVERANEATLRAEGYANEIAQLKKDRDELKRQVASLMLDRDELKDYIKDLCAQVVSLGGVPVKMRERKK